MHRLANQAEQRPATDLRGIWVKLRRFSLLIYFEVHSTEETVDFLLSFPPPLRYEGEVLTVLAAREMLLLNMALLKGYRVDVSR